MGLVPASHPHTLGYACTFYAPTSPSPNLTDIFGRKHPSRDVIFSGENLAQKMPKLITSHDVLEP